MTRQRAIPKGVALSFDTQNCTSFDQNPIHEHETKNKKTTDGITLVHKL
jgi:hypothetical protein